MVSLDLSNQTLRKLRESIGLDTCGFLGFTLSLKTGDFTDLICSDLPANERLLEVFRILLTHYAEGKPVPLSGKLVKFKDLPGGYAYEGAFNQRAIEPIADDFGAKPELLLQASKLLGGTQLGLGGDVSIQLPTLKGIPLTYILWKKEEFDASATVLYDESASSYLPTEDLSGVGEIATIRLLQAKKLLEKA
jgi:hypothetical protein